MRISDWSSDVCSSDLILACLRQAHGQNSLYPKLVGFRESLGIPRCRSVTIRLGQGFALGQAGATAEVGLDRVQTGMCDNRCGCLERLAAAASQHTQVRPSTTDAHARDSREEERRGGKECVSTGRYR